MTNDTIPPAARPGGEGTPDLLVRAADALLDYDDTLCLHAGMIARRDKFTKDDGWDTVERLRERHNIRALNYELRNAPAAVSAPAGEAMETPEDVLMWFVLRDGALRDQNRSLVNVQRLLIALDAAIARSPAPASGAPGEEVASHTQSRCIVCKLYLPLFSVDGKTESNRCAICTIIELQSRLAAAERAGVALREALTFYATQANWFSPSEGFALQYDPEPSPVARDSGAKARAALTPTGSAPSPTKED